MSAPALALIKTEPQPAPRFYRPELDVLRFFAFLAVFFTHGPDIYPQAHAIAWKLAIANSFSLARASGAFGMSMFFVLSSYLITELLLREKGNTGRVHLKAFYIRRILRIWPLYFFAVGLAVILGKLIPQPYWMSREAILSFLLFAVAWVHSGVNSPFNVLWSIGVEEQFYLIWPLLAKWGGSRLIRIASYLVIVGSFLAMVVFTHSSLKLWYNPFVEFLFFAVGALLSIALQGNTLTISPYARLTLLIAGAAAWLCAQQFGHISAYETPPSAWESCFGFLLDAVGCVLIFLGIFGTPRKFFPKWLLYLGRISYGLYVFHFAVLDLMARWIPRMPYSVLWNLCVWTTSLILTIAIAALSFRYLEMPFLRLKEKFEFVKTRPVQPQAGVMG